MDGLAQELIDQIIDCCNLAEKDAMGACGLVCKLWLPRSRYHLFSRVSVNTDNLHSFVDVLESSSSPILTFIQPSHSNTAFSIRTPPSMPESR
ncbi:hypothetical protein B0H13DRAFT_1639187 [Mycena leptocephala]|nr:hypothetical protein B0H13DRAFT_1639187 [Mycena leptocephala]